MAQGYGIVFLSVTLIQAAVLIKSQEEEPPYLQVYPSEIDDRTPLHFAVMLSFGGAFTSIGSLPGVQIALDYINSEPSILPGYSLHYTLTDSQVSPERASEHYYIYGTGPSIFMSLLNRERPLLLM